METEDIWRARKTEKKKGGKSIWRRKISFVEEKNKEEGENVWRRKISGEQKYVACNARKKEKEEIFGEVFGLWRKRRMEKEKVESI